MSKQFKNYILPIICLLMLGCGGGSTNNLDIQIKKALRLDNEITAEEWEALKDYVKKKGEIEGCACDTEEGLRTYVQKVAKTRRGQEDVPIILPERQGAATAAINFSLYLESSGSMYPYTKKGNSAFKDAIYDLLTRIPEEAKNNDILSYVGDVIFPLKEDVQDFIQRQDLYAEAKANKAKINTSSTDINKIIELIFKEGNPNHLNIFVSDCIYSIKGKDASAALSRLKYATKDIFKRHTNNQSLLILQLESEYQGPYYPYSGGKINYNGKRPYYILVFGKNGVMEQFLTNPKYGELQDFSSLKGFKNYHLFTSANPSNLHYSVLPTTAKAGSFKIDNAHANRKVVKGLRDVSVKSRDERGLQFTIAVDLSKIMAENSYKTNPANYTISAADDFEISSIERLADYSNSDKRYIGTATHLMTIHSEKIVANKQVLKIALKKTLPKWILKAATEDDQAMGKDETLQSKTFGFNYMMEGIEEAFHPKGSMPAYFSVSIHLKK